MVKVHHPFKKNEQIFFSENKPAKATKTCMHTFTLFSYLEYIGDY